MAQNSRHVIALGTFDGVHLGHRAVLKAARGFDECIPVAVTFKEPPKRRLTGKDIPMLMTFNRKEAILKELGFLVEVLDYESICDMSAEAFLEMLFSKFSIKAVVCGFNYRFGKGGAGDAALLSAFCQRMGAECVVVPETEISGHTVSSTFIRELIADGNIAFANTLLSGAFSFDSEVLHGDKRGRTYGFPTINQALEEGLAVPKFGVYASSVVVDGVEYPAVTNIGIRPTFLLKKPISETYIIDFSGDIYGKIVTLRLHDFLREEKQFASVEELKEAIAIDTEKAIKAFRLFDATNKL